MLWDRLYVIGCLTISQHGSRSTRFPFNSYIWPISLCIKYLKHVQILRSWPLTGANFGAAMDSSGWCMPGVKWIFWYYACIWSLWICSLRDMCVRYFLRIVLPSCWPWTMLTLSGDIHLSPKHNQPPCTETHLSLHDDSLPVQTKVCLLRVIMLIFKGEVGLEWQDCQQAVTDEFLCIVTGCVFGNRCMSLDV